MSVNPWKAPAEVKELLDKVKENHHSQRLASASIAICFEDSKPFLQNKLNLGKVTKFSPLVKLWQNDPHDFCISVPMDLWKSILKDDSSKLGYLDLQLTRCSVEYVPEEIEENGKKKKVKDEWGRIQYTNEPKLDDEGLPKWKVLPLDIEVFAENVRRYGFWCEQLLELKEAIEHAPSQ